MIETLSKEEFVEKLCDAIVESMGREDLERIVWDQIYEETSCQEWVDLLMLGEDYGISSERAA
jgi:hypothetical protein